MAQYRETVATLNKQLELLRDIKATEEKNLLRFQRKLSKIRHALSTELSKVSQEMFAVKVMITRHASLFLDEEKW